MDDDEHGGDLLPLALLGASTFSPLLAASTSPTVAESTCARDTVPTCRLRTSASPLGDDAAGLASPSGITVGSPSVRNRTSPGSPHGSPAGDVAIRSGTPEWFSRGCSPPACIDVPPGPPHGSPVDVCAAWPCPPACSTDPPGSPIGSLADDDFFGPDPLDNGVASVVILGPSHLSQMLERYIDEGALAVGGSAPAVWPYLPASFYESRTYPASPSSASVIQDVAGGLGPSHGPTATPTSPADSVASEASVVPVVAGGLGLPAGRRPRPPPPMTQTTRRTGRRDLGAVNAVPLRLVNFSSLTLAHSRLPPARHTCCSSSGHTWRVVSPWGRWSQVSGLAPLRRDSRLGIHRLRRPLPPSSRPWPASKPSPSRPVVLATPWWGSLLHQKSL